MTGAVGALRPKRGRLYPAASTPDAVTDIPVAGSLLNLLAFTVVMEFIMPSGSTFRSLYQEEGNLFNKRCFVRINTSGLAEWHYRTPTASINPPAIAGALDDGLTHIIGLNRRETTNLFGFYIDKTLEQTDATDPGALSAEANIQAFGNNPTGGNGFDDAGDTVISHGYVVDIDLDADDQERLIRTGVAASGTILYQWGQDPSVEDSSTVVPRLVA